MGGVKAAEVMKPECSGGETAALASACMVRLRAALLGPQGGEGRLEGLLLQAHDGADVDFKPDGVPDELRQLLAHQRLLVLELRARRCKRANPSANHCTHSQR